MGKSLVEKDQYLELTNGLIKQIYQHANFLANFRYKVSIETLQSRHVGYEIEDFVQEIVQEIVKQFKTKKFPTINHLKSFINLVMEFHYLKEKRKYFYTKSRGPYTCVSLDEDINDYRKIEDTLSSQMTTFNFDLYNLFNKHLYISYDWKIAKIITKKDFANQKSLLMSVNKFVELQIINGAKQTCKIYKDAGFHMTKAIFTLFSQTILDYAKNNDLLIIEEDTKHKYAYNRRTSSFTEEKFMHLAKTCTCGYENKELTIHDTTWQCPKCGRIHDRDSLVKFNSGIFSSYKPFIAEVKIIDLKEENKVLLALK